MKQIRLLTAVAALSLASSTLGLAAAAAPAAAAAATIAPGTRAGLTVTAPPASPGGGPFVSAFVKDVGPAEISNQTALGLFRSWIMDQPGFARSGWVGSLDDLAHKAMTLMWCGPRTPLLAAIIKEGQRRGITVTIQHRKYSLQQIEAATTAIERQAAQGQWAGFRISAIDGISAVDNGITVEGAYTAVPPTHRAALVRSGATTVSGVPVQVAPGHSVTPTAGRDADVSPFNSGGYMAGFYTGSVCSSGFAIVINGVSHTTTAYHCMSQHNGTADYVDRNSFGASSPPPVDQWYGLSVSASGDGAARVMSQTGFYWMFNHGWNSTTFSTVIGFQDLGVGDLVCTEGGNSGEHCDVKVTNLGVSINLNDGYGWFSSIVASQQTAGAIAVMGGDSGGPVMSLNNTSAGQVRAAGMIQAQGSAAASCPQARDQFPCSKTVYFTSMRTIVGSIPGATLYHH